MPRLSITSQHKSYLWKQRPSNPFILLFSSSKNLRFNCSDFLSSLINITSDRNLLNCTDTNCTVLLLFSYLHDTKWDEEAFYIIESILMIYSFWQTFPITNSRLKPPQIADTFEGRWKWRGGLWLLGLCMLTKTSVRWNKYKEYILSF